MEKFVKVKKHNSDGSVVVVPYKPQQIKQTAAAPTKKLTQDFSTITLTEEEKQEAIDNAGLWGANPRVLTEDEIKQTLEKTLQEKRVRIFAEEQEEINRRIKASNEQAEFALKEKKKKAEKRAKPVFSNKIKNDGKETMFSKNSKPKKKI